MLSKLKWISRIPTAKIRATADDLALVQVPKEVSDALALDPKALGFQLDKLPSVLDWNQVSHSPSPESATLFTNEKGQRYPCWMPGDEHLVDDWLLGPDTYPYYFRVFRYLSAAFPEVRLLEFGVRTGYIGLVFSRAVDKPCSYVGVDPNLYLPDGLERATQTYRLLQEEGLPLHYFLLEGFSSSTAVQSSLSLSGPYHFVHIDGEHTYFGKVLDLWIARNQVRKDGFVLVDDLNHHPMIRQSIEVACYLGWFSAFTAVPTKRGLGVLKV